MDKVTSMRVDFGTQCKGSYFENENFIYIFTDPKDSCSTGSCGDFSVKTCKNFDTIWSC